MAYSTVRDVHGFLEETTDVVHSDEGHVFCVAVSEIIGEGRTLTHFILRACTFGSVSGTMSWFRLHMEGASDAPGVPR